MNNPSGIMGVAKVLKAIAGGLSGRGQGLQYDMQVGIPQKDIRTMTPEEVIAYEKANGTYDIGRMPTNTNTSIVDALKSAGQDSSFANREKLAEQAGIKNYKGTAAQNIQLLNFFNQSANQFIEEDPRVADVKTGDFSRTGHTFNSDGSIGPKNSYTGPTPMNRDNIPNTGFSQFAADGRYDNIWPTENMNKDSTVKNKIQPKYNLGVSGAYQTSNNGVTYNSPVAGPSMFPEYPRPDPSFLNPMISNSQRILDNVVPAQLGNGVLHPTMQGNGLGQKSTKDNLPPEINLNTLYKILSEVGVR